MDWNLFEFQTFSGGTWFYLSLLLAIAIFFRFARAFSLRNWDLLTLFVVVPGLLVTVQLDRSVENKTPPPLVAEEKNVAADSKTNGQPSPAEVIAQSESSLTIKRFGYAWLFAVTGYFVLRTMLDLILVRRPRPEFNMSTAGIVFLTVCLFAYLIVVIVTREPEYQGRSAAHVATALLRGETKLPESPGADPSSVLFMMPPAAVQEGIARSTLDLQKPSDSIDEDNIVRSTLILCHLLILVALVAIGWKIFQNLTTGIAMAMLYLLIPVTYMHAIKLDHLIPSTLVLWCFLLYPYPVVTGALLGLASVSFYPLFLIPAWVSFYWSRGVRRFLITFVVVTALLWITVYFVPSLLSFSEIWSTSLASKVVIATNTAKQSIGFWEESTQIYRLPIFIVFAVIVIASAFIPRQKNLADLIAICALITLGVQFWYADHGGTYVHWYLPMLLLLFFRPNLTEAVARPLPTTAVASPAMS